MNVPVPSIGVHELFELLPNLGGATLIDVREPHEFEQVRVPAATLIPLQQVPDRVDELPVDQTVYIICRSGGRSLAAAQWLRAQNIDAVNIDGGTLAWVEHGFPVRSGPPLETDRSTPDLP
jgi:rhodanese-related sulfurtransferase